MQAALPIPYQAIARHGVIGDRRTAALVACDGTLDWLCLPDYDGDVVFGALLDSGKGGYWRLGPARLHTGTQAYREGTTTLVTTWQFDSGRLELADLMPWPDDDRPAALQKQRVVLRRLRCVRGKASCCMQLAPARAFKLGTVAIESPSLARLRAGSWSARLWVSRPLLAGDSTAKQRSLEAAFTLNEGEECWVALLSGDPEEEWSLERARTVTEKTEAYWKRWTGELDAPNVRRVLLSGRLIHLLTYAPAGSVVAAPTASLPERIGNDWNADYRFCWLRDASLSLATLSRLGNTTDARHYLEWLCRLDSSTDAPLQVVYGVRGETRLKQHEHKELHGYRGSQPVRFGNHAFRQNQHDAAGYLLDGALLFAQHGGEWHAEFSALLRRVVNHVVKVWDQPDNSIWELTERRNYLSGRVMSWIALDRAVKLAPQLGNPAEVERWRSTAEQIRTGVLQRGWSEQLGAFRQSFEADNLDAAALLVGVMGFLPADDPRVIATVERIAERLSCDGFVYRFDPAHTPGASESGLPMGEFEGAFLPCTFWLATAYALMSRREQAEAILRRAEDHAATDGLFAEGIDPRTGTLLGNSPLLFSHAEYVRAVLTLEGRE